jgi:hypothetical protein
LGLKGLVVVVVLTLKHDERKEVEISQILNTHSVLKFELTGDKKFRTE